MEKTKKKPSYKKLLEQEKKKTEESIEDLKRLQADFENFKKRIEKEKEEFIKFSNHAIILKLLPFIDDLNTTLNSSKNAEKQEITKALQLLHTNFNKILEEQGLREINSIGEKFDPYKHEVLLQENSDKEPSTILEEIQKGYILHDKILRHAKVKISKIKEEKKNE